MKADPLGQLRRVVDFLARPSKDITLEEMIRRTEFGAMQSGEMAGQYQGPATRRAGKTGGWRAKFTPAQNALFAEKLEPALERNGIRFRYD
jgi:Sulfotransferase domain